MSRPAITNWDEAPIPKGFRRAEPGSPFGEIAGPFYQAEAPDGGFVRAFRVLEKHTNRARLAHGAMLVALADGVMGQTVGRELGAPAVTMRISTSFLAPARLGDWVECRAEIVQASAALAFLRAEATVRHRRVLTADGIFQLIRPGRR